MSEITIPHPEEVLELPPYQKVDRQYFDKEKNQGKLDELSSRYQTQLEQDLVLEELTPWTQESRRKMIDENASIVIPVELSPADASVIAMVESVPLIPYPRSGEGRRGGIVIAGVPSLAALDTDDPTVLSDDALRLFSEQIHQPTDLMQNQTLDKVKRYIKDNGLEKTLIYGSQLVTLLKIFPQLGIPLIIGRGVLNGREVVRNHIPKLEPYIEQLRDPDTVALIQRLTKPVLQNTDDHEFQEAVVLLKTPEALSRLEAHGISGKSLAVLDREHAAVEDYWDSQKEQINSFKQSIKTMVKIREALAPPNKKVLPKEWREMEGRLIDELAEVSIHAIDPRPPRPTVKALQSTLPHLETFTSKEVAWAIHTGMLEALGKPLPDTRYHDDGPDMNDF